MRDSDEDYDYDSGEDSQAGYLSEEEVPNSEHQTKTQAYTVITPVQLAHSQVHVPAVPTSETAAFVSQHGVLFTELFSPWLSRRVTLRQ